MSFPFVTAIRRRVRGRRLLAPGAALLLLLAPPVIRAQTFGGYGDYTDWKGWARVSPGSQAGLASSYDRAGGDYDFNQYEYPPGWIQGDRPTVAATLKGPGIIYRFWMPHRIAYDGFHLRMYFDGETSPRIDAESEQILGGTFAYFSAPLVTTFAGGQVCYEPIVFRDSLRIETENRAGLEHYYQYSYRTFAPGTDLVSWSGTLDPATNAARSSVVNLFNNVGRHPGGERVVVGPRSVPAGGSLLLARLDGPGLIRRLNVRLHSPTDLQLDSLKLRIHWDTDVLPAVDSPVGWFFGAGHGRVPYRSLPLGTDSPAGYYSYWPMPFHQAARVELVNPLISPVSIDSTVVEYIPGPVDSTLGYFHALARQDVRAPGQNLYLLASTFGTGHYVGNLLYLDQDYDDDFMLEGDDLVIVDRADTLHGTGVEDAYNGGYYYNWVSDWMPEPEGGYPTSAVRPLHGLLWREKHDSPPYARADQYRWRIADRVPFTAALEVYNECLYARVGSRWKSVALWYQLPDPLAAVPPAGGTSGPEGGLELRALEPNPASTSVAIRFSLAGAASASIELLDVAGRRVATVAEGRYSAGWHQLRWNRGRLPDGLYLVRLRAGGATRTAKLCLIR